MQKKIKKGGPAPPPPPPPSPPPPPPPPASIPLKKLHDSPPCTILIDRDSGITSVVKRDNSNLVYVSTGHHKNPVS